MSEGMSQHFYEHSLLSITLGIDKPIPGGDDRLEHFRYFMSWTIKYVNTIVAAFRRHISYANVRPISVVDMPLTLQVRYDSEESVYISNPHLLFDQWVAEIETEQLQRIGSTLATWNKYPDQSLPDQLFDLAQGNLFREDFSAAIIQLQTSFEVFVDNCLRLGWMRRGLDEETISKRLENTLFKKKLQTHLSELTGLSLDFSSLQCKELLDWHQKLYMVRNRIVHEGKAISDRSTGFEALGAYIAFRNLLATQLAKAGILSEGGNVNLGIFERNQDDPAFRSYARQVLHSYGYTVGEEAQD